MTPKERAVLQAAMAVFAEMVEQAPDRTKAVIDGTVGAYLMTDASMAQIRACHALAQERRSS